MRECVRKQREHSISKLEISLLRVSKIARKSCSLQGAWATFCADELAASRPFCKRSSPLFWRRFRPALLWDCHWQESFSSSTKGVHLCRERSSSSRRPSIRHVRFNDSTTMMMTSVVWLRCRWFHQCSVKCMLTLLHEHPGADRQL